MDSAADLLNYTVFDNSLQQWGLALAATVVVTLILRIVLAIAVGRLNRLAARTVNTVDDLLAHMLEQTRLFSLIALGAVVGQGFLKLSATADAWVDGFILVLILLQIGLWANTLIADLIRRYLRLAGKDERDEVASAAALTLLAKLTLWSIIFVVGLQNMGFEVTGLITSLGIAGVAVALAAQTVLADLFGSISIMFDKPFVVGDFIIVDDYKGTVENIGIKTTRIRSLSGEQLVLGNNDLLNSRIRNYKQMSERRGQFTVGVTYETPRAKVEQIPAIIQEAIESEELARFDRAHFSGFGDSALLFEVVYWMTVPEYATFMDVQQRVNLRLLERFEKEGVEFAYPTRMVHLAPPAGDQIREGKETPPVPTPGQEPAGGQA